MYTARVAKHKVKFVALFSFTVVSWLFCRQWNSYGKLTYNHIWPTTKQKPTVKPPVPVVEKWNELFPELHHLTKNHENHTADGITNAIFTNLILHDLECPKGGELFATIYAKTNKNQVKRYGGDYFRAILRPGDSTKDGERCHVEDNTDGTYLIRCRILWFGRSRLWVNLMHPSAGIYYLIRNTSGLKTEMGFSTVFTDSKGKKENSKCSLSFEGEYSSRQLCNYSHLQSGGPWLCVKPSSVECGTSWWQTLSFPSTPITRDPAYKNYFDQEKNFNVGILGSGSIVNIMPANRCSALRKTTGHATSSYNTVNVTQMAIKPDGWMEAGALRSLTGKTTAFDEKTIIGCLHNVTLFIIGDSTMRLWYDFFQTILHGKEYKENLPGVWSVSRTLVDSKNNVTIQYRAHGPPLRNPGPPRSRPWVADTLASIDRGGQNTIIFFSIGFHFEIFDPSVFIRRVKLIKSNFLHLRERIPGVRIFVKGFHTHTEIKHVIASDWLSYRFDKILRNVFEGVHGITFIPMWDVSAVLNNHLIHPQGQPQQVYAGIFQAYVCE